MCVWVCIYSVHRNPCVHTRVRADIRLLLLSLPPLCLLTDWLDLLASKSGIFLFLPCPSTGIQMCVS